MPATLSSHGVAKQASAADSGPSSSVLQKQREVEARAAISRSSEVNKHNREQLARTDSNSFGVRFGVRLVEDLGTRGSPVLRLWE